VMARILTAAAALLLVSCNGGRVHDGDAEAEEDVAAEGEADVTVDDAPAGDGVEADGDGPDAEEGDDAPRDWERYDGEVPEIATFAKDDHVASCMRTRACSPENPQKLATCTSAYAHIVGREVGITLQWVAQCVLDAADDCNAIRACMGNGGEPPACVPLETPDRCEGSVLYQCSRASGLTLVFDCAHVGLGCFIDDEETARCGLGSCEAGSFWSGCAGDTLVFCDRGVIVIASCPAAGLRCVETTDEPGRCAGDGAPCDEAAVERTCDGGVLEGCLGGRMGTVDCPVIIPGWTCGETEGTLGCVPPGDECWAYPLLGSDLAEDCGADGVVTCLDGYIAELSCSEDGLGPCVDLGDAARCGAP